MKIIKELKEVKLKNITDIERDLRSELFTESGLCFTPIKQKKNQLKPDENV